MIDVVYPIRNKPSYWKDNELKYSLRSVEKHLTNVRNVWIIGRLPEGITNVMHIPAKDPFNIPDTNILHKTLIACQRAEISDPFLFMNDDHYLLQDFDAEFFPNFYMGTLEEFVARRGSDPYGHRARHTLAYLQAKGLPTKYFDVHYPILYKKQGFIDHVVDSIKHEKSGYILKSLYGNGMNLEGTPIDKDCKGHIAPSEKAICFSTHNRVTGAVYQFLEYKFNGKSRFES